jgi:rhamnogalacturonan acetylesterase
MSMTMHNSWADTKSRRNLGQMYVIEKQIAGEEKIPFLDHTTIIADRYDVLGANVVKAFFPADGTHTSTDGAALNAEAFIAGVKALNLKPLVDALNQKGKAIEAYKPAPAN